MTITINGTTGIADVDGSAGTPAIRGTDANTGIFFGADQVGVATNGVERVEFGNSETVFNDGGANVDFRVEGDADANLLFVDASTDNVGIGTSSPDSWTKLRVNGTAGAQDGAAQQIYVVAPTTTAGQGAGIRLSAASGAKEAVAVIGVVNEASGNLGALVFHNYNGGATIPERARIDSSGNFMVGATAESNWGTVAGFRTRPSGSTTITRDSAAPLFINRLTNDGTLVSLLQADIEEGTISVSGTTVSYNGGHLSRWAQMPGTKDDTIVKGTVMSNLDEMNVYTDAEGNLVDNEQLNKVKVSDVEGDVNVAGVFVNWSHDEQHNVDEINMAMTGDMIIRIAQGVVVQKGDLLMSAGDGTAKPQGDDIVRSKTVAKVTSNHVTCTYADGSYCVPCVLMAC